MGVFAFFDFFIFCNFNDFHDFSLFWFLKFPRASNPKSSQTGKHPLGKLFCYQNLLTTRENAIWEHFCSIPIKRKMTKSAYYKRNHDLRAFLINSIQEENEQNLNTIRENGKIRNSSSIQIQSNQGKSVKSAIPESLY